MQYTSTNSTRNSMDLIEGTTQHYPQGLKKQDLDVHVQRQRWDAFFEPQYSFGAFIHGLNQDEEDGYQRQQQHHRKIDRLIDDGNYHIEHNSIKSPKLLERQSCDMNSTNTELSTAAITPTLPNLYESNKAWGPKDENTLIERLELLKKMRAQPIISKPDEIDYEQEEASHTARWKRHISEKAKQLCKEAKDQDDTSSTFSSPDPDEKIDEKIDQESGVKKYGCRRSFLCFVFGFLFPPIWLFGAFYFSAYANQQTSASRRIDRIWRRRSRIAFGIFTISLMIILVVIFVLNPQSIGWRQSKLIENF